RTYALVAGCLTVLDLGFYALYPARDVGAYLLPAVVFAVPLAARGIAEAERLVGPRWRWTIPAFVGAAVVGRVVLGWSGVDLSGDMAARDLARSALVSGPARARLVTATDEHTFALWYVHLALGERPDVVVVDQRMLQWPWYQASLARQAPDLDARPEVVLDPAG